MFLFRTSGPSDTRPDNPVMDAIRQGAERTGVDFDYLVRTAQRESSLDPNAKARTSSATGLFQFIEQTWLGMVRAEGPRHGLDDVAKAITQGADGRLSVPDAAMRDQIMALRRDPQVAATMAGAFTQRNREQLGAALGREPTGGELYIAHVLGARGAQSLIAAAQATPNRSAALDFPEAAAANRAIFFDRAGKPRSTAEVYDRLAQTHAATIVGTAVAPADSAPAATDRGGLMGLFATGGSRKPVSDSVARLWGGQRAGTVQLASLDAPQRFFPRGDGLASSRLPSDSELPASAPATAAPAQAVMAPLPPERPADLGAPAPARRKARPLDLNAFLRREVVR